VRPDPPHFALPPRYMIVDHPGTIAADAPEVQRTPADSRAEPPRRSRAWLLAPILVIFGAGGAYYFWEKDHRQAAAQVGDHSGGRADEHDAATALPVQVAHPRRGGIERTTTQAGSVHAFQHASLYAKLSGYLKVQKVDIGDRVKLGDLLAVIEDPEVDKAVDQNQAALDQTQAQVRVADAKIRGAQAAKEASEALVKVAEAMVPSKTSNQDLQKKQLVRIAGLVASNSVEAKLQDEQQDRLDMAVADVGVARAEVLSAKAVVINKAALIEGAQADLAEARANVEVARANLAKAKVMQEYTRITSPYDGVVTVRSFHPGDFIRSASEGGNVPVLAVARTDKMRVVLPVPDTDVPFVDKGDKAVLQIVALPGETFAGSIARFSETEDPASRNMRTEVDLPNLDGKLREGMYGRVTVVLKPAAPDSVTIPSSGLLGQTGKGEGSVYVVRGGKAHKVDVHVGNDNGVETEVLSGLKPEDQVITSYNGSLADGTPVKAEIRQVAQAGH